VWAGAIALAVVCGLVAAFLVGRSTERSSTGSSPLTPENRIDANIKADLQTTATALQGWYAVHPDLVGLPKWGSQYAPALHTGDHIDLKTTPGVAGFCLDGWNTAGTATGPDAKAYFFYDSLAGGVQVGDPSITSPSANHPGTACYGTFGFGPLL
jgi:hypothetical protein